MMEVASGYADLQTGMAAAERITEAQRIELEEAEDARTPARYTWRHHRRPRAWSSAT